MLRFHDESGEGCDWVVTFDAGEYPDGGEFTDPFVEIGHVAADGRSRVRPELAVSLLCSFQAHLFDSLGG